MNQQKLCLSLGIRAREKQRSKKGNRFYVTVGKERRTDWSWLIEVGLGSLAEVADICGKVRVAPGKQKRTMGDQVLWYTKPCLGVSGDSSKTHPVRSSSSILGTAALDPSSVCWVSHPTVVATNTALILKGLRDTFFWSHLQWKMIWEHWLSLPKFHSPVLK